MNGHAKTIGAVLLALGVLFTFISGVPWASKAEVSEIKGNILRELSALREDIKEIRRLLGGGREW